MAKPASIRITKTIAPGELGKQLVPPMERLMSAMQRRAQLLVPKRTRNLMRTLTTGVERDGAKVVGTLGVGGAVNGSSGAKYWDYVERGTSRMAAQPYLRPALYQSLPGDLAGKMMPSGRWMMPNPAGPYWPTSQLVAISLLKMVAPDLGTAIGASLPKDATTWRDAGFLTVRALPANRAEVDIPQQRRPILTLDGWANGGDSLKTPWHKANRLLELVRVATQRTDLYGTGLIPPPMPDDYLPARVQAFYLVTEPTQVEGDPSGFARYTADLAVDWLPEPAAA